MPTGKKMEEEQKWQQIDNQGKKVRQLVVMGDRLIALWENGQIWYRLMDKKKPRKDSK